MVLIIVTILLSYSAYMHFSEDWEIARVERPEYYRKQQLKVWFLIATFLLLGTVIEYHTYLRLGA